MRVSLFAAVVVLAVASASSTAEKAKKGSSDDTARAARTFFGSGYLNRQAVPDSTILLPPPPRTGSSAFARDEEAAKAALALRGTPRWTQAAADAELVSPSSTGAMSCAAGFVVGEKETPVIQKLLRRAVADLGLSVYGAKTKYGRSRPFIVNGEPTCTPDWEPLLRKDGAYPSGHSAIGFGWGLILAEIVPDRATQLVARGRAFGDSRRVCNVHWLSDVEEGWVVAAAVVARLHAEPVFQKDLKAARAEAKSVRAKAASPDCANETAGLRDQP